MENIKKIVEQIVKNGEKTAVSGTKKAIDENTINNLILNILIKNKYLEKLNAPIDSGFQDFVQNEASANKAQEIRAQVKKLVDFGLISGAMGEKICEKFGANENSKNAETFEEQAVADFDSEFDDFFKKRNSLYDYIKNSGQDFGKEELEKIAKVVESIEEQAKADYMQELYNNKLKSIKAPNSLASSTVGTELEGTKNLTAQEIARMSTDEFLKNEKLINKLLAKKLIK